MVIRFQDDIDIYEIHVYSIISAIDKKIVWSSQSERRVSNSYNIISRILQYELQRDDIYAWGLNENNCEMRASWFLKMLKIVLGYTNKTYLK